MNKEKEKKDVMMDFGRVMVATIEGGEAEADFRHQLGEQLWMGQTEEEARLGARIYNATGPIALSEYEVTLVRTYIANYAWIGRSAIERLLDENIIG